MHSLYDSSKTKMNHFDDRVQFHFSNRKYGPMNLLGHHFFDGERKANKEAFLRKFFGVKELFYSHSITANLEHGGKVHIIEHGPQDDSWIPKGDALLTGKKGVILCVGGADCPSVILYDPIKQVLGLAHCGWKPLVNNILLNTVGKMMKDFGSDPMSIRAYIGPGACMECYEIKQDVAIKFDPILYRLSENGEMHLDLGLAIREQLKQAGLVSQNVVASQECTVHAVTTGDQEPKYYSWRRDHEDPLNTGIMAAMML